MKELELINPKVDELSSEYVIAVPEVIWQVGALPITNSLITSLLFIFYLSIIALFVSNRFAIVPGGIQALFEILLETVFNMTERKIS